MEHIFYLDLNTYKNTTLHTHVTKFYEWDKHMPQYTWTRWAILLHRIDPYIMGLLRLPEVDLRRNINNCMFSWVERTYSSYFTVNNSSKPPYTEGVSYPFLYNILDLPSGVVPMTTVTSSDIEKLRDYPTGDWGQRAAKKVRQWLKLSKGDTFRSLNALIFKGSRPTISTRTHGIMPTCAHTTDMRAHAQTPHTCTHPCQRICKALLNALSAWKSAIKKNLNNQQTNKPIK